MKRICLLFALFFLFLLVGTGRSYAQNPHSFFYENEFNLDIPTETAWAFAVGFANRGMLQERVAGEKVGGYQHEHLELSQFTTYNTSPNLSLSLGFRYRWRETFDPDERDEFRIIQQLEYGHPNSPIGLEHRIRTEQRLREATIYRARYELETSHRLSNQLSLGLATEALYAVASGLKPEVEQRFSLGLQNSSWEKLELELKLEYRMENYARSLENEYFVITELTWEL